MSPGKPSFLWALRGGGPKQEMEGDYDCSASRGGLTAQLLPGCLEDTGHTLLTNEGPCPVHWGNLSASWPDVN